MANDKKILALDVGDARIGVALSDALRLTAQPFVTVDRSAGDKRAKQELTKIVSEDKIEVVVVGLPLELDGSEAAQAKKVRDFIDNWASHLTSNAQKVSFHYWDERFTTAEAERIVVGSKLKDAEKSAALDRVSAAIILQSFLEAQDLSLL